MDDDAVIAGDPAFFADHLDVGEILVGAGCPGRPGEAGIFGGKDRAVISDGQSTIDVVESHGAEYGIGDRDFSLSPGGAFVLGDEEEALLTEYVSNRIG